jgi:hypothetical protein
MKVRIGPYKHWFGPYQLADLLCFWVKPVKDQYGVSDKPDWVHHFGEWLSHGSIRRKPEPGEVYSLNQERPTTRLYRFLLWIDQKKQRKISVRIDRWDTWSMDHTLAYIILPMLKQLKAQKHGSPNVDDEDVPQHLRSTTELTQDEQNTGHVDNNHEARWDWVLDEMIFAFESKLDDSWQDQFYHGETDLQFKKLDNGLVEMVRGPEDTSYIDFGGRSVYQARITNGFKLFGKYYEALWT